MFLCLAMTHVHAEETEAEIPLELIELLGEMDEAEADLEIAMSDIAGKSNLKGARPLEVKDDE
jgi:hypothetical protein